MLFLIVSVQGISQNEILTHSSDDAQYKTQLKSDTASYLETDICKGCEDQGCPEDSNHCMHHCSRVHHFISMIQKVQLITLIGSNYKKYWYHNIQYNGPYLDPSLKPPLTV